MTVQKSTLVLDLASFIPIIIILLLIPWYSSDLYIMLIFFISFHCVFMIIALIYIIKDLITYSSRGTKVTARLWLIYQAVTPIFPFIIFPFVNSGIVLTGMDYVVYIFWGISSIITIIAAILYKDPAKNLSPS